MIKDLMNVKISYSNGYSYREVVVNYCVLMYEKVNV